MSAADLTDLDLHPVVRSAARGELPAWACASEYRRAHMGRVAALLGGWADALGPDPARRERWCAAGWLHDALRDADPETLRPKVPRELADLPPQTLHGPAVAERLSGIGDPDLLQAIRYHTLGHPDLDTLGRALYLADFLEPGRGFEPEWRASLRDRMPSEMDRVLAGVVAARMSHLLDRHDPIRHETVAFWNRAVGALR